MPASIPRDATTVLRGAMSAKAAVPLFAAAAVALIALAAPALAETHQDIPGPNQSYMPPPAMTVFTEDVEIRPGAKLTAARIWGTTEEGPASVTVRVTGPGGESHEYEAGVAGNRYDAYHPILGDHRWLEGEYAVAVNVTYAGGVAAIGAASFHADVLHYVPPDVRIDLDDAQASPKCPDDPACPVRLSYTIPEGGAVDFENVGSVPHRIYSVAEGYGSDPPGFIVEPGPNAFDGGITQPGDGVRVPFAYPGTILYTCLFHPWMEGLIVIESRDPAAPGGGDVPDPPVSVWEIEGDVESEPPDDAPPAAPDGSDATVEAERAALEAELELLKRLVNEMAADIAAVEFLISNMPVNGPGNGPGDVSENGSNGGGAAEPAVLEVTVSESPVELWGGVVRAQASINGEPAAVRTATLYGPDGGGVLRTSPDGGGITMHVQPTWSPGRYTVVASDGAAEAGASVEIVRSAESCVGDVGYGGKPLCLAGAVTGVSDEYVRVGDAEVRLAGIGASELLPEICPAGAVAVIDYDPEVGVDAASVWCGGVHVNEVIAERSPDLVSDAACGSERPPGACADMPDPRPDGRPGADAEAGGDPSGTDGAQTDGTGDYGIYGAIGDCPIAFLSHGTALAEPVQVLREYRDGLILSGHGGLVDGVLTAYYAVAPHLADVLRQNGALLDAARAYAAAPLYAAAWLVE